MRTRRLRTFPTAALVQPRQLSLRRARRSCWRRREWDSPARYSQQHNENIAAAAKVTVTHKELVVDGKVLQLCCDDRYPWAVTAVNNKHHCLCASVRVSPIRPQRVLAAHVLQVNQQRHHDNTSRAAAGTTSQTSPRN